MEPKWSLRRFIRCSDAQQEETHYATLDHLFARHWDIGGLWPTGFNAVAHGHFTYSNTAATNGINSDTTCADWNADSG
jgi:hypothetical protein